jgi:hypothetical protein
MTCAATRDNLLLDAASRLVREYRDGLRERRIRSALAHARSHVRDGFATCGLELPPDDEYVVLVIGLACRELGVAAP